MNYTNLHSIMSNLEAKVDKILRKMLYVLAGNAMRTKVAVIGLEGVVRHLDADLFMNKEY